MRRLAAIQIAGLLSTVVLAGAGLSAEVVDTTCEQSPPPGSPRDAVEPHPHLSQSISPTIAGVLRWAVRVRSADRTGGTITSRVSYHPMGVDDPTGGLEVVTVSAEVPAGTGERWIEFAPPEPTALPSASASQAQAISIDVDVAGTGLEWAPCRWHYPDGETYQLTAVAADLHLREPAAIPSRQFVVYGWCPATGC